jgi:hypothetical protein
MHAVANEAADGCRAQSTEVVRDRVQALPPAFHKSRLSLKKVTLAHQVSVGRQPLIPLLDGNIDELASFKGTI